MIHYLRMFCALALLIAAPAPSLAQMSFSSPGYAVGSGTYTPTFALTTNIAAAALNASTLAFYTRSGNVVTVSMEVSITPSVTATFSQLNISLPIASTVPGTGDLVGSGCANHSGGPFCGSVAGSPGTTNAKYNFTPSTAAARNHYISFSYLVK